MLQQLHIENFTIIDLLDLEWFSGMTTLTGETGAGKSIIIDALGLVLGDRTDSSQLPVADKKTVIIASFAIEQNQSIINWLEERDFLITETNLDSNNKEADEELICYLKRTLTSDGRSRAFINGQPTTLTQLKELAEQLVDIHGQHAHHALLKPTHQLQQLDQFAHHASLLNQVKNDFRRLHQLQQQYEQLKTSMQEQSDRKDLLRYQIQELDEFNLTPDESKTLGPEHKRLANAQLLQSTTLQAYQKLYGQDPRNSTESVGETVERICRDLEGISQIDPALIPLIQQLQSAAIEIQETSTELEAYAQNLDMDPEHFNYLEQRLSTWHDLARKHQIEADHLIDFHQQLIAELNALNNSEDNLEQLALQLENAKNRYFTNANKLSSSREKSARQLEAQVNRQLQALGMKNSLLSVQFEQHKDKPGENGLEQINLMIRPNPGLPAQALSKIASGGELSRVSLAIQVVTVAKGNISCMIFDEVDVGIGGGTAEVVGRLLRKLSASAQVLCITHQPQVASQGHQHLLVEKTSHKGKTQTQLIPLKQPQRIEEIARMLGGIDITQTTREHAEEMLEAVKND